MPNALQNRNHTASEVPHDVHKEYVVIAKKNCFRVIHRMRVQTTFNATVTTHPWKNL